MSRCLVQKMTSCFDICDLYKIDKKVTLYILGLKTLNKEIQNKIDEYIIQLIYAPDDRKKYELRDAKIKILNLLNDKDEKQKMGLVAEFFIHLFLLLLGYKQESLFKNLEERSAKKGFDGVYSQKNQIWIMESKSGLYSENQKHLDKVKDAYRDLKNKIIKHKDVKNNPWSNALSHMWVMKTKQKLRQIFINGDKDFENGKGQDIANFNLIPSATIFLQNIWIDLHSSEEDVKEIYKTWTQDKNFKSMNIICFTKASFTSFVDYLKRQDASF